jgi:outer membrane biosynthesis protein TonB
MKKIIQIVVAVHIALLLVMTLSKPQVKKETVLKMQTVTMAPKTPAPVQVQAAAPVKKVVRAPPPPVKKSPPPKTVQKPAPVRKVAAPTVEKPRISSALAKELQESIAKIHQKSDKDWTKVAQSAPGFINELKIDLRSGGSKYEGELVGKLQNALDLPEVGEVEIELTLRSDGHFSSMQIVRSESNLNGSYLVKQLKLVRFPPFTGELLGEETHTFSLTFCNR